MQQFNGFDPILFLNISGVKKEDNQSISDQLLVRIGDYLAVRFLEIMPEELIKNIQSTPQLLSSAQNYFLDFNQKIKLFLEDFKREYSLNFNPYG